jgi:hypothetical protein
MPLGDVCIHTATPILTITDTDEESYVEGEPDEDTTPGVPFGCLFLMSIRRRATSNTTGAREDATFPAQRKIESPTILYEAERDGGSPIEVVAEDEIDILAEEILGPSPVRFQVEGDPIPMARPGEVIGWECRLKRVID